VQVLRTKTHLLEARAPFLGKPDGRLYYTGDRRFGQRYKRADKDPEHASASRLFATVLGGIPSHLEEGHPFWTSKHGKRWLEQNDKDEVARKQLYNHPDYAFYDETD